MEMVRVGIVGLSATGGWAAQAHVLALRNIEGYELRALAASSIDSARTAGEAFGVKCAFDNAEDLATCDDVDLVVVTVKVPEHRHLVTTALAAGKAVLCEWPLGNGLAETRALADDAAARRLSAFVGLQARSAPTIRYLRDLIAGGYLGEVLSTSLIGSGGNWGTTIDARNLHTRRRKRRDDAHHPIRSHH